MRRRRRKRAVEGVMVQSGRTYMPDQREGFDVGDDQSQDCELPCEGYL